MGTAGTATRGQAVGPGMQSVGLSTRVVVDQRPVTRQGLTGMQTKPLGPGRQIADDKFFITELRQRISDIRVETDRLRQEATTIEKDNQMHQTLVRQYDAMDQEKKDLEGQLADFNLALDKLKTNTSVDEITDFYNRLKQRNAFEAQQVDEVFLQTQTHVKKTKAIDDQIREIYDNAAERMATLGEEMSAEYNDLQDQRASLQKDLDEREGRIQLINHKIHQMQQQLQSHDYLTHKKGLELTKAKRQLQMKREQLVDETDSSQSPEEIRERIQQKVKDMKADEEATERRMKTLDQKVEKLQATISEREQVLQESKKHALKAQRYEEVYERDRMMNEFLSEYEPVLAQENRNKATLKNTIVSLLRHISKQIHTSENLPDAGQLTAMKEELSFKEAKLKNSRNTLALLEQDFKLRKEELEKIQNLDKKINVELSSLKDKMEAMHIEMSQFKSEDELRHQSNEAKKTLTKEKARTKHLREASKVQVQVLAQSFEKRKRELASNETMKKIDSHEQRLRSNASTVFTLQDFISSRKRESDYASILGEVKTITLAINKNIIEQLSTKGNFGSSA